MIIGICGGTGCGKTTVSNILKAKGAYIILADEIAHSVILKGKPAYFNVIETFGKEILKDDMQIDRKKLGSIVFSNKVLLDKLNLAVHKYILDEIDRQIAYAKFNNFPHIVLDAPLLIETNLHEVVDKVWLVYSPIELRLERLQKRDNISKESILKRINSQTPFEKLKPFADFIIFNDRFTNLEKIISRELEKGV